MGIKVGLEKNEDNKQSMLELERRKHPRQRCNNVSLCSSCWFCEFFNLHKLNTEGALSNQHKSNSHTLWHIVNEDILLSVIDEDMDCPLLLTITLHIHPTLMCFRSVKLQTDNTILQSIVTGHPHIQLLSLWLFFNLSIIWKVFQYSSWFLHGALNIAAPPYSSIPIQLRALHKSRFVWSQSGFSEYDIYWGNDF